MKRPPRQHKSIANKKKKEVRGLLVPTPDNWHPSINGGFVSASLIYHPKSDLHEEIWTVVFGGDDDYFLGKSFDKYDDAKKVFDMTTKGSITQKRLIELGFEQ